MRITQNYLKVEGHESLIRDLDSKAIIATDDNEYASYKIKRDQVLKTTNIIQQHSKEIEDIKFNLLEIKQMLSSLIKDK